MASKANGMNGNPFKKAAPRPNVRAKASKPARPRPQTNVPTPMMPGMKPGTKTTKPCPPVAVTSKAKRSVPVPAVRQGPIPGSPPGRPGSSSGANPGW